MDFVPDGRSGESGRCADVLAQESFGMARRRWSGKLEEQQKRWWAGQLMWGEFLVVVVVVVARSVVM